MQRTVLYVEDNPVNQKLMERILARRKDLTMIAAATGELGVELAISRRPDVILMDIALPGISGYEALARIKANGSTAEIPVIAVSANALPTDIERGREAGFRDYLTKPLQVARLFDSIDAALGNAAPAGA